MSASGQKATFQESQPTSALLPEADIGSAGGDAGFVPTSDISLGSGSKARLAVPADRFFTRLWIGAAMVQERSGRLPARDAERFSSQLLRRVGAVQVRPLGARQNAELDDAP
jgi:hypothetical protein